MGLEASIKPFDFSRTLTRSLSSADVVCASLMAVPTSRACDFHWLRLSGRLIHSEWWMRDWRLDAVNLCSCVSVALRSHIYGQSFGYLKTTQTSRSPQSACSCHPPRRVYVWTSGCTWSSAAGLPHSLLLKGDVSLSETRTLALLVEWYVWVHYNIMRTTTYDLYLCVILHNILLECFVFICCY